MQSDDVLRLLLVDDDPIARRGLRRLLAGRDDVVVVGECADAEEALDAVSRLEPDAVLLDIEMPGKSGFDVAQALGEREHPYVVFVTAYDRYAVEAFKSRALDYVLKPVSRERLAEAIGRARLQRDRNRIVTRAREAIARPENGSAVAAGGYLSEVLVRIGLRKVVIAVEELDWIEADSYYARLHTAGRSYLLREPLQQLERRLDPRRFVRVHRSAIVNVQRVREVRVDAPGERSLLLSTGALVRVSRTRWRWFARLLRDRTQIKPPQGAGV